MKFICTILLALLLFSCNKPEPKAPSAQSMLPEEEKRKVFSSLMDTTKKYTYLKLDRLFRDFYSTYYPDNARALKNYSQLAEARYYYRLNEELINPEKIVRSRKWARCVIFWSWSKGPHIIEIEKKQDNYFLTTKVVTPPAYYTINDEFKSIPYKEDKRTIGSDTANAFFNYISASRIITDSTKYPRAILLDGSRYYLEVIMNCRYVKINLTDAYHTWRRILDKDDNRFSTVMDGCDSLFKSTPLGKSFWEDYYRKNVDDDPETN